MTETSSSSENVRRARLLRVAVAACDEQHDHIATTVLHVTKSALGHKMAARRPVRPEEIRLVEEHLGDLGCQRYTVALISDSQNDDSFVVTVNAVSAAAALRAVAELATGEDPATFNMSSVVSFLSARPEA